MLFHFRNRYQFRLLSINFYNIGIKILSYYISDKKFSSSDFFWNSCNLEQTEMFTRKKMSQAEKHRGWVKMKNVSAVKISIQVIWDDWN